MSFSSQVKEELEKHISSARHCQIAEVGAFILNMSNVFSRSEDEPLLFETDNEKIINKLQMLLKKTYGIDIEKEELKSKNVSYRLSISDNKDVSSVLNSVRHNVNSGHRLNDIIVKNSCCKRAYLRETFLLIGSMTSPEKGYHLEFVSVYPEELEQIREIIRDFDVETKITTRKKNQVLYIKEGAAIVDLLNIMGAHISLMNMENAIILKDMRNDLNRKVNCETANIIKSINAASRQVEDIEYIKKSGAFNKLPEALRQMAEVRLMNPDTPLKDLGNLLDPPVGKSGVNHRLRRLSEFAEELRESAK